jgi:hypothetical protein
MAFYRIHYVNGYDQTGVEEYTKKELNEYGYEGATISDMAINMLSKYNMKQNGNSDEWRRLTKIERISIVYDDE